MPLRTPKTKVEKEREPDLNFAGKVYPSLKIVKMQINKLASLIAGYHIF